MDFGIRDKVIVITGAARGIGRTLALGLAADGARVAVVARDRARAQIVVDEITAMPDAPAALAVQADVSDESAVISAAAEVDEKWGRIDGLINNAGWMAEPHRIVDMDLDTLDQVLRANLVSSFLATKHFAPLMIRGGGGRIIYLSSAASIQTNAGGFAYAGAKAAINILANVVHQELADDGIRTIAIAPGLTETPGMRAIVTEDYVERVASRYPSGRVGQPEDLLGLAAFLCSDASEHLSGSLIMVRPPVNR